MEPRKSTGPPFLLHHRKTPPHRRAFLVFPTPCCVPAHAPMSHGRSIHPTSIEGPCRFNFYIRLTSRGLWEVFWTSFGPLLDLFRASLGPLCQSNIKIEEGDSRGICPPIQPFLKIEYPFPSISKSPPDTQCLPKVLRRTTSCSSR
jgi:hypothetical protein